MKNTLIVVLLILLFNSINAQVSGVKVLRVSNSTTVLGENIPIGSQVYDIATDELWVCTTAVVSTATLTTASASFSLVNDITGQTDPKYIRSDTSDETNGGVRTWFGGAITGQSGSGATIQIDGFQRTGPIYLHSHTANVPDASRASDYLENNSNGDLFWNKNGVGSGKVWHSLNDGAGSTLDADLLDGVEGSSYLRSDVADEQYGGITFNNGYNVRAPGIESGNTLAHLIQGGWSGVYDRWYEAPRKDGVIDFTREFGYDFVNDRWYIENDVQIGNRTYTATKYDNWETAFSWGDHSVEGYLTDITTQTDPKYLRSDVADTKTAGTLTFSDDVKLQLGTSSTGTEGRLKIQGGASNNVLFDLGASNILIRDQGNGNTTGHTFSANGNYTATGEIQSNYDKSWNSVLGNTPIAWETIAKITIGTGTYRAYSAEVEISEPQTNHGSSASLRKEVYNISVQRSAGTEDDSNTVNIQGIEKSFPTFRIMKVQDGAGATPMIAELQVRMSTTFRSVSIRLKQTSKTVYVGTGGSIVYYTGADFETITANTAGTEYLPAFNDLSYLAVNKLISKRTESRDGYSIARRDGGVTDSYLAAFGTSTASNQFVFGGSTTNDENSLDNYLRVGDNSVLSFTTSGTGAGTYNILHSNNANTELTQFLRSDVSDTKTSGKLTFSDDVKFQMGTTSTGGDGGLEIQAGAGTSVTFDLGRTDIVIRDQSNSHAVGHTFSANGDYSAAGKGTFNGGLYVDGKENSLKNILDYSRTDNTQPALLQYDGTGGFVMNSNGITYEFGDSGIGGLRTSGNLGTESADYTRMRVDQTDSANITMDVSSGSGLGNINVVGNGAFTGLGEFRILTEGAEALRVDENGNVGIGTTTPAYPLDVVGNIQTNSTVFANSFRTDNGSYFTNTNNDIYIYASAGNDILLGGGPGGLQNDVTIGNGNLVVSTGDIQNTENGGFIGTTSSAGTAKLQQDDLILSKGISGTPKIISGNQTLDFAVTTSTETITIPNKTGTMALVEEVSQTGTSSLVIADLVVSTILTLDINTAYTFHIGQSSDKTKFFTGIASNGQEGGTTQGAIGTISDFSSTEFDVTIVGTALKVENTSGTSDTYFITWSKLPSWDVPPP